MSLTIARNRSGLANSSCLRNQLDTSIVCSTTVLLLAEVRQDLAKMTRWSAVARDPPQPLRARLRLALHGYGGNHLNPVVHHERGRYCRLARPRLGRSGQALHEPLPPRSNHRSSVLGSPRVGDEGHLQDHLPGKNLTDSINYFGSADSTLIEAYFTWEERRDFSPDLVVLAAAGGR